MNVVRHEYEGMQNVVFEVRGVVLDGFDYACRRWPEVVADRGPLPKQFGQTSIFSPKKGPTRGSGRGRGRPPHQLTDDYFEVEPG
jgi:hypothetical protein